MLKDGEIDLLGSVSYTQERAESIAFSTYAEGTERYWIYTRKDHAELADGDPKQMNGCRIGAADGSYQKELLKNGWTAIRSRQRLFPAKTMMKCRKTGCTCDPGTVCQQQSYCHCEYRCK